MTIRFHDYFQTVPLGQSDPNDSLGAVAEDASHPHECITCTLEDSLRESSRWGQNEALTEEYLKHREGKCTLEECTWCYS